MTDNEALDFLQSKTGIKYSAAQREVLLNKGGTRILACAGSGKTMVLTHLIAKRLLTGEIESSDSVLCITYSKDGADEMNSRLKTIAPQPVTVSTIHAFFYRLLKKFGYNYPICTKRAEYIHKAAKEAGLKLTDDEVSLLDSLISYQVNNMMSSSDIYDSYRFTLNISLESYVKVQKLYQEYKKDEIDFDDMQLIVYALLCREEQRDKAMYEYCREHWQHYFIDEFQDVSKLQYAILKEVIARPDNLVIIGDDDQSIYSWRGADPSIISSVGGDFNLRSFVLGINYRSGGEIVERAAIQIANNKVRTKKEMKAHISEGRIKLCLTNSNLYTETKQAYSYITDLLSTGVQKKDIAIIARNNTHLSLLNAMLFLSNIPCQSKDAVRLTNTALYKDLRLMLGLAQGCDNPHTAKEALWRLVSFLGVKGASVISDIMLATGLDMFNAIRYGLDKFSLMFKGQIGMREVYIKPNIREALSERFSSVISVGKEEELSEITSILSEDSLEDISKMLIDKYSISCAFFYNTEDRQRMLKSCISLIKDLLNSGYDYTIQSLNLLEQYESKPSSGGDRITLTTAHSAKGKEWRYVILLADDNITFPAFTGIKSILNLDRVGAYKALDEERRLHYVSMTRAKEELVVIADKYNPSVFLLEAYNASLGNYRIDDIIQNNRPLDTSVLEDGTHINLSDEFNLKRLPTEE